ncbi:MULTISPECIES: hypothetical protein [unclassified Sphingomonas]|uniref:hypothetical protein n=1 Tax=unclassified Sphingomonas TaxID=196159 RepID=UPI0007002F85|nr:MULTISPECIES: hypothetical protein [unclassified Sphingomonas]KQX20700.1 hypothetical protein ASD17_07290 [Sphingomonas sp. Root1294]KQY68545.1 hypothetical protein ASD39_03810 [Sphingomonas sp. Root50]KRB87951.1 hypothetical protein ASE22_20985 [Sphingomonas sp. Root720]
MNRSWHRLVALALAALGAVVMTPAAQAETKDAVKDAEGLWAYTLLEARGQAMPLTGVILFKDGLFVQQSIFDGEPFATQGAMAHAGTFGPGPRGVHMVGEQTISTSPGGMLPDSATAGKEPALRFRRDSQHDISVDRDGETMTIVFGSGTIQKFRRIGPAKGDIYKLENGVLALVDGHFVLVAGDATAVVTGYGTVRRSGTAYELGVTRWAEATPDKAINRKDGTIKATFDGKVFTLADGRAFRVVAAPKK